MIIDTRSSKKCTDKEPWNTLVGTQPKCYFENRRLIPLIKKNDAPNASVGISS